MSGTGRLNSNLDWVKIPMRSNNWFISYVPRTFDFMYFLFRYFLSGRFCVKSSLFLLWRHRGRTHFLKRGHVIYRWKRLLKLIQNHIKNNVWKWSRKEVVTILCNHVTKFKVLLGSPDQSFFVNCSILSHIYFYQSINVMV